MGLQPTFLSKEPLGLPGTPISAPLLPGAWLLVGSTKVD